MCWAVEPYPHRRCGLDFVLHLLYSVYFTLLGHVLCLQPVQFQMGSASNGTEIAGFYLVKDKPKKSTEENEVTHDHDNENTSQNANTPEASENATKTLNTETECKNDSKVEVSENTTQADNSVQTNTKHDDCDELVNQVSGVQISQDCQKSSR